MAKDSSHKAIQQVTFECSILFSNNKQDNTQTNHRTGLLSFHFQLVEKFWGTGEISLLNHLALVTSFYYNKLCSCVYMLTNRDTHML